MSSRAKKGFTLLEMLLTIAIIAILTAVAIPTFSGVLDKARRAADLSNARSLQIALATMVTGGDVEFKNTNADNAVWILVRRDPSVQIPGYPAFNRSQATMFCGANAGIQVFGKTSADYNVEIPEFHRAIQDGMRGEVHSNSRDKKQGWDWYGIQYSCDAQGNLKARLFSAVGNVSSANPDRLGKTNIERAMGR